ncbi:MAG TPA: lamin tail domain-containing protein [Polyangiaceae bacterium]|nr:lamin tail domain-containing protein [Polyangiaceae bacterium]
MKRWIAGGLALCSLLVATEAPAVSTTIVISEFRTRGPNGSNDEFVEIFNKSNAAVNIGGYKLMVSDGAGNTALVKQVAASTILQPKHFYLFANNGSQGYSGLVPPSVTYSQSIPDDGGIAIFTSANVQVDAVGMSAGSAYEEGTPLAPMSSNVNQSYERDNGGCAATVDTDDNASDFRFNASTSGPQNAGFNCNSCTGVTCNQPPNGQCWAATGTCSAGTCSYTQFSTGTSCSDGDACTVGDACDASGLCVSGAAATCNSPPAASCSDPQTLVTFAAAGTCSSVAGCVYAKTTTHCDFGCNGTTKACNPDPCTAVSCNTPPTSGCYAATGTCTNGTCVYAPLPRNTPCTDGNACTTGDLCNASGTCLAGAATPTDDGNPCTVDACNTTTGVVTHTNVSDGSDCDDGNKCNGVATCQSGSCQSGTPVTCNTPPIGGCYASPGTCSPATGACTYTPSPVTTTCNDGDACTTGDACDGNGTCGGSTVQCPSGNSCVNGTTARHTFNGACTGGACVYSHTDESCAFGCNAASGLCNQDPCVGVTCNSPPDQCHVGSCSGGLCVYTLKTAGSACDDADPCTNADECSGAGSCSGTPLLCSTPPATACLDSTTSRSYAALGTCTSGSCDYGTPVDTHCDFGCDAATGHCNTDPCATLVCDQPPDQCHIGTCNGACQYTTAKPDGSTCDDGNPCTVQDSCTSGTCAGEPKVCNTPPAPSCVDANTSRTYDASTTCNGTLGDCAAYPQHDTNCPTGCDAATGLCNGDPCAGMTCTTPPGNCYLPSGTCTAGVCSYSFVSAGVSCDDGNPCTENDACDGLGACSGTPSCGDGGIPGSGGASGNPDAGTGAGGATSPDASVGSGGATGPDASVGSGGATSPDAGTTGGSTGTGGASPGSGGAAATGGHSTGTGGVGLDGGVDGSLPAPGAAKDDGGCGCSVPGRTSNAPWSVALVAIGVLIARRRRARAA